MRCVQKVGNYFDRILPVAKSFDSVLPVKRVYELGGDNTVFSVPSVVVKPFYRPVYPPQYLSSKFDYKNRTTVSGVIVSLNANEIVNFVYFSRVYLSITGTVQNSVTSNTSILTLTNMPLNFAENNVGVLEFLNAENPSVGQGIVGADFSFVNPFSMNRYKDKYGYYLELEFDAEISVANWTNAPDSITPSGNIAFKNLLSANTIADNDAFLGLSAMYITEEIDDNLPTYNLGFTSATINVSF